MVEHLSNNNPSLPLDIALGICSDYNGHRHDTEKDQHFKSVSDLPTLHKSNWDVSIHLEIHQSVAHFFKCLAEAFFRLLVHWHLPKFFISVLVADDFKLWASQFFLRDAKKICQNKTQKLTFAENCLKQLSSHRNQSSLEQRDLLYGIDNTFSFFELIFSYLGSILELFATLQLHPSLNIKSLYFKNLGNSFWIFKF